MIDLEQVRLCFHAVVHQRLGETNVPNIVHHNSLHHITDDNIFKHSTFSYSLPKKSFVVKYLQLLAPEVLFGRPLTYRVSQKKLSFAK